MTPNPDSSHPPERPAVDYLTVPAEESKDNVNGRPSRSRQHSQHLDKELPLNPDERAGLRAQKRQYTKELQARKPPEIDPNHAYPDFAHSKTLILCMSPFSLSFHPSFVPFSNVN